MNVLPMKASEQLEDVLDYFNVVVSQNDLFSRCQVSVYNMPISIL